MFLFLRRSLHKLRTKAINITFLIRTYADLGDGDLEVFLKMTKDGQKENQEFCPKVGAVSLDSLEKRCMNLLKKSVKSETRLKTLTILSKVLQDPCFDLGNTNKERQKLLATIEQICATNNINVSKRAVELWTHCPNLDEQLLKLLIEQTELSPGKYGSSWPSQCMVEETQTILLCCALLTKNYSFQLPQGSINIDTAEPKRNVHGEAFPTVWPRWLFGLNLKGSATDSVGNMTLQLILLFRTILKSEALGVRKHAYNLFMEIFRVNPTTTLPLTYNNGLVPVILSSYKRIAEDLLKDVRLLALLQNDDNNTPSRVSSSISTNLNTMEYVIEIMSHILSQIDCPRFILHPTLYSVADTLCTLCEACSCVISETGDYLSFSSIWTYSKESLKLLCELSSHSSFITSTSATSQLENTNVEDNSPSTSSSTAFRITLQCCSRFLVLSNKLRASDAISVLDEIDIIEILCRYLSDIGEVLANEGITAELFVHPFCHYFRQCLGLVRKLLENHRISIELDAVRNVAITLMSCTLEMQIIAKKRLKFTELLVPSIAMPLFEICDFIIKSSEWPMLALRVALLNISASLDCPCSSRHTERLCAWLVSQNWIELLTKIIQQCRGSTWESTSVNVNVPNQNHSSADAALNILSHILAGLPILPTDSHPRQYWELLLSEHYSKYDTGLLECSVSMSACIQRPGSNHEQEHFNVTETELITVFASLWLVNSFSKDELSAHNYTRCLSISNNMYGLLLRTSMDNSDVAKNNCLRFAFIFALANKTLNLRPPDATLRCLFSNLVRLQIVRKDIFLAEIWGWLWNQPPSIPEVTSYFRGVITSELDSYPRDKSLVLEQNCMQTSMFLYLSKYPSAYYIVLQIWESLLQHKDIQDMCKYIFLMRIVRLWLQQQITCISLFPSSSKLIARTLEELLTLFSSADNSRFQKEITELVYEGLSLAIIAVTTSIMQEYELEKECVSTFVETSILCLKRRTHNISSISSKTCTLCYKILYLLLAAGSYAESIAIMSLLKDSELLESLFSTLIRKEFSITEIDTNLARNRIRNIEGPQNDKGFSITERIAASKLLNKIYSVPIHSVSAFPLQIAFKYMHEVITLCLAENMQIRRSTFDCISSILENELEELKGTPEIATQLRLEPKEIRVLILAIQTSLMLKDPGLVASAYHLFRILSITEKSYLSRIFTFQSWYKFLLDLPNLLLHSLPSFAAKEYVFMYQFSHIIATLQNIPTPTELDLGSCVLLFRTAHDSKMEKLEPIFCSLILHALNASNDIPCISFMQTLLEIIAKLTMNSPNANTEKRKLINLLKKKLKQFQATNSPDSSLKNAKCPTLQYSAKQATIDDVYHSHVGVQHLCSCRNPENINVVVAALKTKLLNLDKANLVPKKVNTKTSTRSGVAHHSQQ